MAKTLLDTIKAANEVFMAAYAAGDFDKLSSLYTEDCKLLPPGSDVVVGRQGVKDVFGGAFKAGAVKVKLEIDEIGSLGDNTMLFERSHFTMLKENGETFQAGKYVVIWKLIDGQWYLYSDIFNSNS